MPVDKLTDIAAFGSLNFKLVVGDKFRIAIVIYCHCKRKFLNQIYLYTEFFEIVRPKRKGRDD